MGKQRAFKYSRHIRYVVFFLTLFFMIFSVKRYLGDFNIEKEIAETKQERQDIEAKGFSRKLL